MSDWRSGLRPPVVERPRPAPSGAELRALGLGSFRIAIDGPAGSGKSTVARAVAARAGLTHFDTGALYRAVGLACHRRGVDPDDGAQAGAVAESLELSFRGGRLHLGDEDISQAIRGPEASRNASRVSACPPVRRALAAAQRAAAERGGVVMEGRDIGSVVMPDAELKVFLTASLTVRARRRAGDLAIDDPAVLARLVDDVAARDARDTERPTAPLCQADGAVALDSSQMGFAEVVDTILALAADRASGASVGDPPHDRPAD